MAGLGYLRFKGEGMANEMQSQKVTPQSTKSSITTLKEFMRPWAKLCAAYPRYDLGKATVTVYHERLCKFSVDDLVRAADILIDSCEFFPSVAEIIETIRRLPVE